MGELLKGVTLTSDKSPNPLIIIFLVVVFISGAITKRVVFGDDSVSDVFEDMGKAINPAALLFEEEP